MSKLDAMYQADPSPDGRRPRAIGKLEGRVEPDKEKIAELKGRRLELGNKFDETSTKMRRKFDEGSKTIMTLLKEIDNDENNRRRTMWISIRNIQSMVVEGYELFSNKHEYDAKLKLHKKDYIDVILPRTLVGWVGLPFEIPTFYDFLDSASIKYNNEANQK